MPSVSSLGYLEHDINRNQKKDRISWTGDAISIRLLNPQTDSFEDPFLVDQTPIELDLDFDGIADRIWMENGNLRVQILTVGNTVLHDYSDAIDLNATVTEPTVPAVINDASSNETYMNRRLARAFGDVDGDGRADFVRFDGNRIYISYARQLNGELYFTPEGDFSIAAAGFLGLADINLDGRMDFLATQSGGDKIQTQRGTLPVYSKINESAQLPTGTVHAYLTQPDLPAHQLVRIEGSFGKAIEIEYANARHLPGVVNVAELGTGPVKPLTIANPVVQKMRTHYGPGLVTELDFEYGSSRFFMGPTPFERQNLGFSFVRTQDSLSGRSSQVHYNQSSLALALTESQSVQYHRSGSLKAEEANTYTTVTTPQGTVLTLTASSSTIQYMDDIPLVQTTVNMAYDAYGNLLQQVSVLNGVKTEQTVQTFSNDAATWQLGRPLAKDSYIDGVLTASKRLSYSGPNLSEEETLLTGGIWARKRFLAFDSHGNPTRLEDARGNVTEMEYDAVVHAYPVRVRNALGHEVNTVYNYNFGTIATVQGANGETLQKFYDIYGRPTYTVLPGDSDWSERYEYRYTGDPERQRVTHYRRANPGEDPDFQTTFTDGMGRTIRKESAAPKGHTIVETFEYDVHGRLQRQSRPTVQGAMSPVFSSRTYDAEDKITEVQEIDGSRLTYIYDGYTGSVQKHSPDNVLIDTKTEVRNARGNVTQRTTLGKTTRYEYDLAGRVTRIIDPEDGRTDFTYDMSGRRLSVRDDNSGLTLFAYDVASNLIRQTDARGQIIEYTYDAADRLSTVNSADGLITYHYDQTPDATGKLSTVQDLSGRTEMRYDARGNVSELRQTIDDITFLAGYQYDALGRITTVTYPDGSRLHNKYASGGPLSALLMDTHDGTSAGHPIVTYDAAFADSTISRTTGNGVTTAIQFDPLLYRPTRITTTLPGGIKRQDWNYSYDVAGNLTGIEDSIYPARSQTFAFDAANRLTSATGKYGTKTYEYTAGGNLTRRGNVTLSYANASHKQAVSAAFSDATGLITYDYDAAGNLRQRGSDQFAYDATNRLRTIQMAGDQLHYTYNFAGQRVKKTRQSDGLTVYKFGDFYEIERFPGQQDRHTLYFRGYGGEIAAQLTRTDAVLLAALPAPSGGFFSALQDLTCQTLPALCSGSKLAMAPILRPSNILLLSMLGMLLLYAVFFVHAESLKQRARNLYLSRAWSAPLMIVVLFLNSVFLSCVGILPGEKKGAPPWIIFPGGDSSPTTPSVENPNGSSPIPGVSGGSPIAGMYFYHPDHLGSVRMITGSSGMPAAGGEFGGASDVNYTPYGSIHRTDSGGPDIFRHKYTGQEEDRESGLLYYKARYYDPFIGRFLSADSILATNDPQGLNRYMYVGGNPVKFNDPGGHKKEKPKWHYNMIKDFYKAGIREWASGSFNNTMVAALLGSHNQAKVLQEARAKRAELTVKVGAYFIIGATLMAISYGSATPALTPLGAALFATMGAVGTSMVGYAIGSALGYSLGGTFGTASSGWDEKAAQRGAAVGGLVGAMVGSTIGSAWSKSLFKPLVSTSDEWFLYGDGFSQATYGRYAWLHSPAAVDSIGLINYYGAVPVASAIGESALLPGLTALPGWIRDWHKADRPRGPRETWHEGLR